ncbi:MAG: chaperonin [Flavobacteriaceae bacterium]|jgi:co-chaperonin GroES (HSP10)|nr:chaperonin [Flavobacteriaceae bacterium]
MKLLGDRILCRLIPQEKKTESGLILITADKKEDEYEVINVGVKVKHLKPGDRVRKFRYSDSTQAMYNGESCLILSESCDVEYVK